MRVGPVARITRVAMRRALDIEGGMTRAEIEGFFNASRTTVQFHLTAMRECGEIYIADWREPLTSGSWSPVWAVRTLATQRDVLVPSRSPNIEQAVVVQAHGVKSEHARIARARHDEFGMWGQLVRLTRVRADDATSEGASPSLHAQGV